MSSRLHPFLVALAAVCVFAVEPAQAQVNPGQYRIVGAFHRWSPNSGAGFYGNVRINRPGPVVVRLNDGSVLRGRIDRTGRYIVTSVNGLRATGFARMRARSYAAGNFNVRTLGSGVFILGRIGR